MSERYVLGFAFSPGNDGVLLRYKASGPSAVIGKLNGVGGHLESPDLTSEMSREWSEEVLGPPLEWRSAGLVYGDGFVVFVLKATAPYGSLWQMVSRDENEPVVAVPMIDGRPLITSASVSLPIVGVRVVDLVPNLAYLIPACIMTRDFEIRE